jgi:Na+/alanine symporter
MEHPDAALDRERARGELAGVGIAARHGGPGAERTRWLWCWGMWVG